MNQTERGKSLDLILQQQEKYNSDVPELSKLHMTSTGKPHDRINLVSPEPQTNGMASCNDIDSSNEVTTTAKDNQEEINSITNSVDIPEEVRCTACNKNLKLKKKKICKHPRLNVLLCKRCLKFINSNDFKKDEMGIEEFCTWCGDGGNLVCCDYCEKAYCKHCIKRNLGKPFLKYLLEAGEDLKWKCFSCDQNQILPYIQECNCIMQHLSELHMLQSTMDVNKTHISNLNQRDRIERLSEISKKVADAPNTHVGMKSSFKTVEIDSDNEQNSLTTTDEVKHTNYTDALNSSASKVQVVKTTSQQKVSEEVKVKEEKKKKQTVVVLSSDDESEEEIVVVSKSGKKTVLNKSLLLAAQALLKNKNLNKNQTASQCEPDSSSSVKTQQDNLEKKDTKKNKKSLGNFMRLSLNNKNNSNKKSDSEEINESSMSSSDSDAPPERSDSSDDDTTDDDRKKKKKMPKKSTQKSKVVVKKEREIINGVVIDDEQPGPSGIRPKNKMQKLREKTAKKQVSESSEDEFIPDINSLQEHRKEENKKIISKINSPDLSTIAGSNASPKSKKIMSPMKNSQKNTEMQQDEPPSDIALDQPPIHENDEENTPTINNEEQPSKENPNIEPSKPCQENLVDENVVIERPSSEALNPDIRGPTKENTDLEKSNQDQLDLSVNSNEQLDTSCEDNEPTTNSEPINDSKKLQQCTVTIQKLPDTTVSSTVSSNDDFLDASVETGNDAADTDEELSEQIKEGKETDDDKQEKESVKEKETDEDKDSDEEKEESMDTQDEASIKQNKSEQTRLLRSSKRKKQINDDESSSDVQETTSKTKIKSKDVDSIDTGNDSEEDELIPKHRKSKRLQKKDCVELSDESCEEVSSTIAATIKKTTKRKKTTTTINSDDSDVQVNRSFKKSKLRRKRARLNSNGSSSVSMISSSSGSEVEEDQLHADTINSDSDSSSGSAIIITKKKKKTPARKKRKSKKTDEEDDEEESDGQAKTPTKGRRKIRKILKDSQLTEETKRARELEEQRRKRLLERTKAERLDIAKVLEVSDGDFVLEKNEKKEPLIFVDADINKHLKPHQRNGIKFMYDCTIESIKNYKKGEDGGGCLLAHCMGLGKTLQIVSFVHTCYKNENINMKRFLVVAPLNTVLNWEQEFDKWLSVDERMDVFVLSYCTNGNKERLKMIRDWFDNGGVLICGYEMYRNLVNYTYVKSKKMKEDIKKFLVDPGPELVVCDEGHVLRNSMSAISIAMNNIKTKRRIVLTGTPLQNNLPEYHVMVDFVKPKLLGTKKEFQNRFANPINNGRCSNSTPRDVRIMKQRCHILYQLLSGCVQRQDYSVLTPFLPPKREYTIMVRLSEKQIEMYNHYLNEFVYRGPMDKFKGSSLFSDFHCLSRIWSHPWSLHLERIRQYARNRFKEDEDEFIDDDDAEETSESEEDDGNTKKPWNEDTSSEDENEKKRRTRRRGVVSSDSDDNTASEDESDKDVVVPAVPVQTTISTRRRTRAAVKQEAENESKRQLRKAISIEDGDDNEDGDDVKSKSVGSLRSGNNFKDEEVKPLYEKEWYDEFLKEEDEHNVELSGKLVLMLDIIANAEVVKDKVLVFTQSLASLDLIEAALGGGTINGNQINWCHGIDYFRMDGSTPVNRRKRWSDIFNDPDNDRCRLFLISTKAGSLGINMVAANRVIIFDCSWNPSHDVQSVFRVYRFGQEKPVYVYRLIAQGTMEEKVYDRQITKLAVASRVVDEMQIERHFTDEEIRELYTFKPDDSKNSETPQLPKDPVLAEVLQRQHPKHIVRYHEHDLLLENVADEEMTEEEKKLAWKSYEEEKEAASRGFQYRPTQNNFQSLYEQQQQLVNSRLLNMSSNVRVFTPINSTGGVTGGVGGGSGGTLDPNIPQRRYFVRLPDGSLTPYTSDMNSIRMGKEQQFRMLNMASINNSVRSVGNVSNIERVINQSSGNVNRLAAGSYPNYSHSNGASVLNPPPRFVRYDGRSLGHDSAPINMRHAPPPIHHQQQIRPKPNGSI